MEMKVRWQSVEAEGLPEFAGKYVVEIDAGWGMCYMSTRSFNPESQDVWFGMGKGERVTHWLRNLRSVTEIQREGLRNH